MKKGKEIVCKKKKRKRKTIIKVFLEGDP